MVRNINLSHNIVHPTGIIKTQRKLSDSAKRDFMFDLFKKKKSSNGWTPSGKTDGRQQNCISPHDASDSFPPDPQKIKAAIRRKYAEIAISSDGNFEYPTGRAGAEALGYDPVLSMKRCHHF